MANWAIIIGIDRYAIPDARLRGAVVDALSMRNWLLDPDGGNVPADNIALVLGPMPDASDPGVPAAAPERDHAVRAVADLIARSGGSGERLYFYYSGHGISAREGFSDEDALLFSDFDWLTPNNSWSLRSLWEYFETWDFKDQFLFVDACRNAPRVEEVRIGHWPRPRRRDLGTPPAQQFILHATSPGLRAVEAAGVDNERGAFTEVLLDGLRGAGFAKSYDSAGDTYQIRWESLAAFVIEEMTQRQIDVTDDIARAALQIPQQAGARGVAGRPPNPVVATVAPSRVPDGVRRLDVLLAPDDVVPVAEVQLLDDAGQELECRTQLPGLPVTFELAQRTYLVHASAPEYAKAVARPPVSLYSDKCVRLSLSQDARVPKHAERLSLDQPCRDGMAARTRGGAAFVVTGPVPPDQRLVGGVLTVDSTA